jgi:high-affinity Fe2+/Pb2+ permease
MDNPFEPSRTSDSKKVCVHRGSTSAFWKYICGIVGGVVGLFVSSLVYYALALVFGIHKYPSNSDWTGVFVVVVVSVFAGLGMTLAESSHALVGNSIESNDKEDKPNEIE